jgi:DNA-binding response OmpR family regulator
MTRVLIAEDDLMIADMLEEALVGHDYEVCGIARTVAKAIALGHLHKPDFAILDLRLAEGGLGTEIAVELAASRRTGILYATGNVAQLDFRTAEGDACLAKPFRSSDMLRSLEIVAEIVATGTASPPYPRGLTFLHPVGPAALEMHR